MRTWIALLVFVGLSLSGCFAMHGVKRETGKPLDEQRVAQIVKGRTTADEILAWFGTPSGTSRLGGNELFVYKHCRDEGTMIMLPVVGQTQTREICNELTVTLTASGHVKAHSFQKRF
jgi:outer membrane protein assembly factor BamE (lipoprotein component of BamABCDE complex)